MTEAERQSRARAQATIDAIDAAAEHDRWAERELANYNPTAKRRLLHYLTGWMATQPGHGADCNCGECD